MDRKQDAEEALSRCWAADAMADADGSKIGAGGGLISALLGSGGEVEEDVEGTIARQLVKADAHLMGAVMQLMLGQYIRAGLNLRVGWKLYHACAETRDDSPTSVPASLAVIVDFGIGMFNLVASLLPATYLAIAEYIGFGGTRAEATRLLGRSYEADQVWSPFSALLLLYFYTQLAPNLGLFRREDRDAVEAILASPAAQRNAESALFLWMDGMAARLYARDAGRACHRLALAQEAAAGLPALQIMVLHDTAWTNLEALEWSEAATTLTCLLRHHTDGKERRRADIEPYAAVYAYKAALCCVLAGNGEDGRELLAEVGAILDSEAGRAKTEAWGAERYAQDRSAYLAETLGKGESNGGAEVSRLVAEMLVLWDRADALPPDSARTLLQQTGQGPDAESEMLLRSALLVAAEDDPEASQGEAAALLDALIAATADLDKAVAPATEAGAESGIRGDGGLDTRHVAVFARYLRAKWLFKARGGAAAEGAGTDRAKLLVQQARSAGARNVHMVCVQARGREAMLCIELGHARTHACARACAVFCMACVRMCVCVCVICHQAATRVRESDSIMVKQHQAVNLDFKLHALAEMR